MSSKQSLRHRYEGAAARIPNPLPGSVSTGAKFVVCGAIGAVVWLSVLAWLTSKPSPSAAVQGENKELLKMLAVMIVPAVPAAVVYRRLPASTVDVYHRFGKGSALFFTTNVFLSTGFLLHAHLSSNYLTDAFSVMQGWAVASVLIPGPYLGILVAARWSK